MPDDRILIVDDDPLILSSFKRRFGSKLDVHTAGGADEGLKAIASNGPYAVVVSDFRMPVMNGVDFLARVKDTSPDTARILLTGYADLQTAIESVNKGNIFRLLTKPCPAEIMIKSLVEGIKQYRLATAEKELLEGTLHGAVNILTELLALAKPDAFGRSSRIESLVRKIAMAMGIKEIWEIEIAAALSQIGLFAFPDVLIRRINRGKRLTYDDQQVFKEHPKLASELIAKIPRMEKVAKIVAYQEKNYDGSGIPEDSVKGQEIPLGARILKAALDFDVLTQTGNAKGQALASLKALPDLYDPDVLAALESVIGDEAKYTLKTVSIGDLRAKMVLAEDLYLQNQPIKLLAKGHEITSSIIGYLRNLDKNLGVRQPIQIIEPISGL